MSHRAASYATSASESAASGLGSTAFRRRLRAACLALALLQAAAATFPGPAHAQRDARPGAAARTIPGKTDSDTVQMDFKDVDLSVVIEMIARTTGKNFIYDDKVRGKVTSVKALAKVHGSLSRGDVLKVLNKNQHKIQRCYERALLANPSLAGRPPGSATCAESSGPAP